MSPMSILKGLFKLLCFLGNIVEMAVLYHPVNPVYESNKSTSVPRHWIGRISENP